MSVHRGSIHRITFPQLGLGIVAIAAVAVAVLIGQRGAAAPDDAVGAGEPTPSATGGTTAAPVPGRPPAGHPSSAASVVAGGGTTLPSLGRKDPVSPPRPATIRHSPATAPASVGPSAVSTAGAGQPAMTAAAPSTSHHTPAPAPHDHRSRADPGVVVRMPPIVLPSCLVGC
ncbi:MULTISPECIES: hypothetical protein [Frankia]|uniref:Uncharacterized protein n=1 Tax=Frankia alni (strain DSM 45986 / CECT 9034 / ACN14a) TaxID=326424 RepID=Q0RSW1_FRAAA|nr:MULTISPECIES: hypothetical protein [Frankia]CAJ59343.1 hypothetical protein; putative signal peptide [Frankia alni ACN14a]